MPRHPPSRLRGIERLLLLQRRDTWQFLAFQPFQEGAAGGRDVGELVFRAGMGQRRDGVAAAGDRQQAARFGASRHQTGNRVGAGVEGLDFEGEAGVEAIDTTVRKLGAAE